MGKGTITESEKVIIIPLKIKRKAFSVSLLINPSLRPSPLDRYWLQKPERRNSLCNYNAQYSNLLIHNRKATVRGREKEKQWGLFSFEEIMFMYVTCSTTLHACRAFCKAHHQFLVWFPVLQAADGFSQLHFTWKTCRKSNFNTFYGFVKVILHLTVWLLWLLTRLESRGCLEENQFKQLL